MKPIRVIESRALVLSLFLMAALAVSASEEFAERIVVTEVEIPVRVLVDGRPLRGLDADDFELFDRGVQQKILSCEEMDLAIWTTSAVGPAAAVEPDIEEAIGRKLLVVFDHYYSRRQFLARALRGIRSMVDSQLHPRDQLAVAIYEPAGGLELVDGFTSDREQNSLALDVEEAILDGDRTRALEAQVALHDRAGQHSASEGVDPAVRRFERLASSLGTTAALTLQGSPGGREGLGGGLGSLSLFGIGGGAAGFGSFEPGLDNSVGRSTPNSDPLQIADDLAASPAVSGVRTLALTFADVVTLLRDLEGQKQMIYLSEGFAGGLLEDAAVLYHVQNMLEAFRRTGWTLHAIDVEGVPEFGRPGFDAQSLFYMAVETGGELFENYNNLGVATGRLLDRTSVTYVLTFQPPELSWDGRYHDVEVRLKHGPRAARLYHRPGYHAPKPEIERGLLERRVDAAELILTDEEVSELNVFVLAAPMPQLGDSHFDVPFVVEVPSEGLLPDGKRSRWRKPYLEIHVYVLDPAGTVLDLAVSGIELDLERDARTLEQGGLRYVDRLVLPSGEYRLRILVLNHLSGAVSLSTVPVSVGAIDRGSPSVLPPLFLDLSAGWKVVVDHPGPGQAASWRYPFTLGKRSFAPAVRPVLRPDETIGVCLMGTHLSQPGLVLGARVLDPEGQVESGGVFTVFGRVENSGDNLERIVGSFQAEDLAAGEYRLEVTAFGQNGQVLTRNAAPFLVDD